MIDDITLASEGLLEPEIKIIEKGKGDSPKLTDTVTAHYEGRLIDGTVFDSSLESDIPLEVDLSRSIKCWAEGIQRMREKGRAKLVCPPELGYGDRPYSRLIPPQAVLIFELELVEIPER